MSTHQHDGHHHDHGHHDGHDHVHDHPVGEGYAARPHPEFVVLEIGEDVGALIVHANAALHGAEIEISPTGADSLRQHKEVLERRAAGGAAFTAVFDGLPAGSYTLWLEGTARAREVAIAGGAVAQLDWSAVERHATAAAGTRP
jgi:hypothetical protein